MAKNKTLQTIIPTILEDTLNKDLKDYWDIYCQECLSKQDDLLTDSQIELGKIIEKNSSEIFYEKIASPDIVNYWADEFKLPDFLKGFEKYMVDKYTKNPPVPLTQLILDTLRDRRRFVDKAKYNELAKSAGWTSRVNGIIKVWESSDKDPKICKIMEITDGRNVILLDTKTNKEFTIDRWSFDKVEELSKMSKAEIKQHFDKLAKEKQDRAVLGQQLEENKFIDFTKDTPYQSKNTVTLYLKYYGNGDSFGTIEEFYEQYSNLNNDYKEASPLIINKAKEYMQTFAKSADKLYYKEHNIHEKPFAVAINSEEILMMRAYLKSQVTEGNFIGSCSTKIDFIKAINNKKMLKELASQTFDFSDYPPEIAKILEAELSDVQAQIKDPLCGENDKGMMRHDSSSKLYSELKPKSEKKHRFDDWTI